MVSDEILNVSTESNIYCCQESLMIPNTLIFLIHSGLVPYMERVS